jgi:hypothetical protein
VLGRRPGRPIVGRVLLALVAGVLVVGVLAAAVDDVGVQQRLHRAESRASTTQAMLERTTALLASTRRSAEKTDRGAVVVEGGLTRVTSELATARQRLVLAQKGVASGSVELGAVRSCTGGASRSVSALEKGDQDQAVADLSSVAAVCESMLGPGSGGPVYPFDFADLDGGEHPDHGVDRPGELEEGGRRPAHAGHLGHGR